MNYPKHIAANIKVQGLTPDEIEGMIEIPPTTDLGDYALPCFRLAKTMRKPPAAIAEELKAAYPKDEYIEEVTSAAGYLNFRVNRKRLVADILAEVEEKGERYGSSNIGGGRTVCIDYSSINIAKPSTSGTFPPPCSAPRSTGSTVSSVTTAWA